MHVRIQFLHVPRLTDSQALMRNGEKLLAFLLSKASRGTAKKARQQIKLLQIVMGKYSGQFKIIGEHPARKILPLTQVAESDKVTKFASVPAYVLRQFFRTANASDFGPRGIHIIDDEEQKALSSLLDAFHNFATLLYSRQKDPDAAKTASEKFCNSWTKLFGDVTYPYIHIMTAHAAELEQLIGSDDFLGPASCLHDADTESSEALHSMMRNLMTKRVSRSGRRTYDTLRAACKHLALVALC